MVVTTRVDVNGARTEPSLDADHTEVPPAPADSANTESPWPDSTALQAHLLVSHTRMVWSSLPVHSMGPSAVDSGGLATGKVSPSQRSTYLACIEHRWSGQRTVS